MLAHAEQDDMLGDDQTLGQQSTKPSHRAFHDHGWCRGSKESPIMNHDQLMKNSMVMVPIAIRESSFGTSWRMHNTIHD